MEFSDYIYLGGSAYLGLADNCYYRSASGAAVMYTQEENVIRITSRTSSVATVEVQVGGAVLEGRFFGGVGTSVFFDISSIVRALEPSRLTGDGVVLPYRQVTLTATFYDFGGADLERPSTVQMVIIGGRFPREFGDIPCLPSVLHCIWGGGEDPSLVHMDPAFGSYTDFVPGAGTVCVSMRATYDRMLGVEIWDPATARYVWVEDTVSGLTGAAAADIPGMTVQINFPAAGGRWDGGGVWREITPPAMLLAGRQWCCDWERCIMRVHRLTEHITGCGGEWMGLVWLSPVTGGYKSVAAEVVGIERDGEYEDYVRMFSPRREAGGVQRLRVRIPQCTWRDWLYYSDILMSGEVMRWNAMRPKRVLPATDGVPLKDGAGALETVLVSGDSGQWGERTVRDFEFTVKVGEEVPLW